MAVAGLVVLGMLVAACAKPQSFAMPTHSPDAIGWGSGPSWYGADNERVHLRWMRWEDPCHVTHEPPRATRLWIAISEYRGIPLPTGAFDVLEFDYVPGAPPRDAVETPIWSAAGQLWLGGGDDTFVYLVRDEGYLVAGRPRPKPTPVEIPGGALMMPSCSIE